MALGPLTKKHKLGASGSDSITKDNVLQYICDTVLFVVCNIIFLWSHSPVQPLKSRKGEFGSHTPTHHKSKHTKDHYLYPTLAQRWPGCRWPWCSSSAGLWTGAGTPGCQSSRPQPHWAWSPRSSGRSAAAWAPDPGCCHRESVECPAMNIAGPLLVT